MRPSRNTPKAPLSFLGGGAEDSRPCRACRALCGKGQLLPWHGGEQRRPVKGYREYPGSYPQGQSHSDSRPEKRAPEHLPKAGGIEWSSNFAQKYVFSTLYKNKNRLPGALSSKSPITGCAAPLKCVELVGRKLYKNKPGG